MSVRTYIFLFFILFPGVLASQTIRGLVAKAKEPGSSEMMEEPILLPGASIYWLGTKVGTLSNASGMFRIERAEGTDSLVIQFAGFQGDTLAVGSQSFLEVYLQELQLGDVEILQRKKSTDFSFINPMQTQLMGQVELTKAACCNLSESFETNPSIDMAFSDAVTGTRQIQLLGLAGPYTQISRENMPHIRGLNSGIGLAMVPGPWMESIQLTKGIGSVVNGFESVVGQINVELQKPSEAEPVFVNLFGNEGGRMEANVHFAHKLNKKWSTALLLHGRYNSVRMDRNEDGFMDNPLEQNFYALNRWQYMGTDGWMGQAGVKLVSYNLTGGELDYQRGSLPETTNFWGTDLRVRRIEGWAKAGHVFKGQSWKSIGLQLAGSLHQHESTFGRRGYNADQQSGYANLIYQTIIGNTNHKLKLGSSFQVDRYDEQFVGDRYERTETVPGIFTEYTLTGKEKIGVVAGLRVDHHNLFGTFATPRLHVRYTPFSGTVVRMSAGRGQRTANILIEQMGLMASARRFVIQGENTDHPYGLAPEVAWNGGVNISQRVNLWEREVIVSVDFYRTIFENQVVVDWDASPQEVQFYNLDGQSFANSFQAQLDYEVLKRLDVRMAYRWYDVRTTYRGELLRKPLVAEHRAFFNMAYTTPNDWKFDATWNWEGRRRLPTTTTNPVEYRREDYTDDFFLLNGQITKIWKKKFEVYIGFSNLLNFRQEAPILASDQPFSDFFDSSMVWGPIMGRNSYGGIRWRL
ncbi:MAG: TonB-dependent receptor [Bacteroidota bacterium]